jgi:hypothetical protein
MRICPAAVVRAARESVEHGAALDGQVALGDHAEHHVADQAKQWACQGYAPGGPAIPSNGAANQALRW